ncbi:MAG TPA: hypothetical protein VGH19_06555 [Verrucomicrobiae bacterium]
MNQAEENYGKLFKAAERKNYDNLLFEATVKMLLPCGSVIEAKLGRATVRGEVIGYQFNGTDVIIRNLKTEKRRDVHVGYYGIGSVKIISVPEKVKLDLEAWWKELQPMFRIPFGDANEADVRDFQWAYDQGLSPIETLVQLLEDER